MRAGGMTEVVERLPNNPEALSSNPSTDTHTHKKRNKREMTFKKY
jgi:hypothetical protein